MLFYCYAVPLPVGGVDSASKAPSGKSQKVLDCISTRYFIGTEDGEVVCADLRMEKDNETGKPNGRLEFLLHSQLTKSVVLYVVVRICTCTHLHVV